MTMKVTVTIKSEAHRPSEYKLSPAFSQGINHTETFWCQDSQQHAKDIIKFLDIQAYLCGMKKGEFESPGGEFETTARFMLTELEEAHKMLPKKDDRDKKLKSTSGNTTIKIHDNWTGSTFKVRQRSLMGKGK